MVFLLGGYFVSMVIFPLESFYIPELSFALMALTVVFWWGIGKLVFKLIDPYAIANRSLIGGSVRFARRLW
jgi:hypothetical protein